MGEKASLRDEAEWALATQCGADVWSALPANVYCKSQPTSRSPNQFPGSKHETEYKISEGTADSKAKYFMKLISLTTNLTR